MSKEKGITGVGILGFLALIYIVNQICTQLLPIFGVITIIAIIVSIIISLTKPDYALWPWIITAGLVVLTFVSFLCGPGFASTDIGGSLVDAGNESHQALETISNAEKTAENTIKNVSKEIIDTTINATTPNDPNIKATGEIAKIIIDLS